MRKNDKEYYQFQFVYSTLNHHPEEYWTNILN